MVDPEDNIDYSEYLFGSPIQVSSECDDSLAHKNIIGPYLGISNPACKMIFFTLNASTEHSEFEYNKVIKRVINEVNYNKKLEMIAQWYFEDRRKNGTPTRLHVHGMLTNVPVTFYPYEPLCKYISKKFHEKIGRPKVPHKVSSDVQWARDEGDVAKYCTKFQDVHRQHLGKAKYLLPRL